MNLSKFSGMELIRLYGELLAEMRGRKLIRTKNVTGELGEYIVVDYYNKTKGLPKLEFAPPVTKNIDAISDIKPLFEYVVVIKLDDNYQPTLIIQLDWETFFRHKHWYSRINAYNLLITKALIEEADVVFAKA